MESHSDKTLHWLPAYVNLHQEGAPEVQLPRGAKYPLPLPPISEDVVEEGDLLANIPQLRYQDYNLQDLKKFPQFQPNRYLIRKIDPITKVEKIVPHDWIANLASSGLLKLLKIPHFGRSLEVNVIIKILLFCVHEDYLWLESKIDLNIDVIHRITGLSKIGDDSSVHFVGKKSNCKLAAKITQQFNLKKGTKAYDSVDTEDYTIRFTVQLLARQVLRKCRPNEVLAGAINLTLHAKDGKQYNWCLYLLNQFMDDCRATQESNQLFHYSWLLIIMAFVTWKDPNHSQFVTLKGECRGVQYASLWAHPYLDMQKVSNYMFFTYYQQLCTVVANRSRITKNIIDMYKNQVCFTTDLHHIYLKPHGVETKDWYTGSYQMSHMDNEEILKEWLEEWRNPADNNSDSEKVTGKQTYKGKQKQGEGKSTKKRPKSKERPTSQSEPTLHHRKKRKVVREPYE